MFGESDAMTSPMVDMTTFFVNGKRKRINLVAICINMFLPWFMFSGVFMMLSFSFHYEKPALMWCAVFACFCVVCIIASLGYKHRYLEGWNRTPMWFGFSTVTLSIAFILGLVCGQLNYSINTMPGYRIGNLNTYPNVDPSISSGQMLMDAGKMYFAEGSKLDFQKAMGFKNDDLYCVVPITSGDNKLESYDFWAVGINCCSGTGDFRCGEFNNPKARSGMRQVRDDERPFFRLAVQEAEAAFQIKSEHPLFFYWMQDPLQELEAQGDRGWRFFVLGIFCFFGVNTLAVFLAIVGFSKLGNYPTT